MTTTIEMDHINAPAETDAPEKSHAISKHGNYLIKVRPRPANAAGLPNGGAVLLQFVLDSTDYLLLGIAFSRRDFSGASKVGQLDFPRITIDTINNDRVMTVTNTRRLSGSYDYIIMIQEVGTGEIGIIDPEIVNESAD